MLQEIFDLFDNGENWIQGRLFDDYETKSKFCMSGAVDKYWFDETTFDRVGYCKSINVLRNAAKNLYGERGSYLTDFNDHKDTTFEDIARIFKFAIEEEQNER